MKKRIMMLTAMAVMVCGIFAGCGKTQTETKSGSKSVTSSASSTSSKSTVSSASTASETKTDDTNKKLSVVCTIFPEYDWIRELVGDKKDNYEITYLMDKGVDLHSYQPTAEDIAKIANCDLFVYVGGESDGWVKDALKESKNDKMQVVNLLEALGNNVKEEEVVEGMQEEDEHDHDHGKKEDADHDHEHKEDADHDHDHKDDADHDHDHDEDGHHHDEVEYDEHVWLSLRNASSLVNELAARLQIIDPENKDYYAGTAAEYTSKLGDLDSRYLAAVKKAKNKTVLFGDRFPFRYLVDDYGLKYYAAFVGCSAETEASFETVAFLAKKADELKLNNVLVIENSDQKIAKKIVETTKAKDQKIVEMNSMQSVTADQIADGATYLGIMEANLKALEAALK
ncbi:ABC transporter, substrate-binding protein [Catonella morbi ATCC 51271]|uniref:ABC transporter, substrate-binding protein n=1 Tax=Catonella morbi ATCC 51271 TaxID=592026 RepID=V2Z7E1_9FIRM|nr:metal ABC transporter substrate-binding protein [Catonella morbi]ESL02845.1 ABC transporter, substrate-binding protein [Catonella morbi ATCC 51271]